MIKNNQIWENTSKIAKIEHNNGEMRAVIFNIKSEGLKFEKIINKNLEKQLKKMRMRPTEKVLTYENS